MTILVWDGLTLAADRRSTTSWGAHDVVTKIEKHNGALLGLTGKPAYALRLREWYKAGAVVSDFPPQCAAADEGNLVVITPKGEALVYSTGPYPERWENEFCAWGGGRDFAIAAMHCGKKAREAAEIACLYCVHCGGGVDTLELGSKASTSARRSSGTNSGGPGAPTSAQRAELANWEGGPR